MDMSREDLAQQQEWFLVVGEWELVVVEERGLVLDW